jgi:hypothetical protein
MGPFTEIKFLCGAGEIWQKTTLFFYLVTKVNDILSISGVRVMVPLQTASRVWDSKSDYANITVNRWLLAQPVQRDLPVRAKGLSVI